MVRCRIVKKDGTTMPAADACKSCVLNLLLHSMFNKVTVLFNNKTVSDPSNMYAYRSYLERLLNCNGDIQKYRLKSEGWHKDKHDKMDEAEPKDNTGLVERRKYCAESPDIVLIDRPHADVFHIDKLIPPGSICPLSLCRMTTSFASCLVMETILDRNWQLMI